MSAFRALDAARAAGVDVRLDGKDLFLSGASAPPTDVIDMLRRHKRSIVGLLQPTFGPIISATDIAGSRSDDISCSPDITASTGITDAGFIITSDGDAISSTDSTALGRRRAGDWSIEDWQAYFDERAAIAEFDGGLPRPEAEKCAFDCCVAEWLYRHPVISPLGPCPVCGDADRPNDDLLPVGLGGGEVWLHRGGSAAWRAGRIAEAGAALAVMGIRGPGGNST